MRYANEDMCIPSSVRLPYLYICVVCLVGLPKRDIEVHSNIFALHIAELCHISISRDKQSRHMYANS